MNDIVVDGIVIAPSVVDTIVAIAAEDIEGVTSIGTPAAAGIMNMIQQKPTTPGVEYEVTEDDQLKVGIHIEIQYGYVLPEIAANVRSAVAEAIETQLGVQVQSVDVYVDGIRFE